MSRNKTWTPNDNHHTVETFTQAFPNDLEKEEKILKQIPRMNLSKKEKVALKTLSKREDNIITKAEAPFLLLTLMIMSKKPIEN